MHRDDTIGINLPVFKATSMAISFITSHNSLSLFPKQGQSSRLKTRWTPPTIILLIMVFYYLNQQKSEIFFLFMT